MRIPYVIDNDRHKLADVLNQVLRDHRDLALDVATAYFNIRGFQLLAEGLKNLGSLRLLLGAEPESGEELGLRPRLQALQASLRGMLNTEPFRPETMALVEDLIRFLREARVQVRLYERGFCTPSATCSTGTRRLRPCSSVSARCWVWSAPPTLLDRG